MKSEVQINGVTLTRKQVEEALTELNKPEEYIPKPGDVFRAINKNSPSTYANARFLALDPKWFAPRTHYVIGGVFAAAITGGNLSSYDFNTGIFRFEQLIF